VAPFEIRVNGTLQTEGTDFASNSDLYSSGLVTFLSGHVPASGAVITATYCAFTPVTFTEETEGVTMNSLFGKASVKLKEVFYS
jgi:hypothetical protein